MLVLNPFSLNAERKKKLLKLFDEVRNETFPNLKEQYASGFELKKKIDLAILEAIGLGKEVDTLLIKLHEAIRVQFETLGKL